MAVIGYIRVSSNKQTLEHQHFEIEQYAKNQGLQIDKWVEEKISSRKALRSRKLGTLLDNLQENDILISCEISRLGRSLLEVIRDENNKIDIIVDSKQASIIMKLFRAYATEEYTISDRYN